jgi:hypothetical protein
MNSDYGPWPSKESGGHAVTDDHIGALLQPQASSTPSEPELGAAPTWSGRLRALWNSLVGGIGLAVGILPHVLHHAGLLAGSALVAGAAGTALFGALGLVASIPLLLRLHRRFGTWRAPVIGLLIFAAMFALSAFVIGPAISVSGGEKPPSVPSQDHTGHH